jgi:hypothetical protein
MAIQKIAWIIGPKPLGSRHGIDRGSVRPTDGPEHGSARQVARRTKRHPHLSDTYVSDTHLSDKALGSLIRRSRYFIGECQPSVLDAAWRVMKGGTAR